MVYHPTMKRLDLDKIRPANTDGWQAFFGLLSTSHSSVLEEFSLSINSVGDDGVPSMVHALSSITSLKTLHIGNQCQNPSLHQLTTSSWAAFSILFGRPSSRVVTLSINIDGGVTDEVITCLAPGLANNNSLKTFDISESNKLFCMLTEKGSAVLENVLCSKESIESIYHSNHALEELRRNEGGKYVQTVSCS